MQKSKFFILVLLVFLAIFLRVYGIGENFHFSGELGKEMLYIREFANAGKLPMVGMPTSHEWLSYGPLYYWLMIPIYYISRSPFILFWSGLLAAVFGLIISFFAVKKLADEKTALITTTIMSISPLLIWQTQLSKLHLFFLILIPVFMLLMDKVWRRERKFVFWLGLTYGLMFSFHFSQIPLLGVVGLLFWIKRKFYKIGDWARFMAGALIPNLTYFLQDKNIAVWVPYRVIKYAFRDLSGSVASLQEYLGSSLFWEPKFWTAGTLMCFAIFAYYIWKNHKKITVEFLPFYLVSTVTVTILANILHGGTPVHYYLPIFAAFPIVIALVIKEVKYWPVILVIIFALNFKGYFEFQKPDDYVSYTLQNEIAKQIVDDSKGREFSIQRIGPYDYFPDQYSQNYEYLILLQGGNLVENSEKTYTINDWENVKK